MFTNVNSGSVRDNGRDAERTIELVLTESPAPLGMFGHLPPAPVEVETRRFGDGIGYFRLGVFLNPDYVMGKFRMLITRMVEEAAPGLILDLRGNPGGLILMSNGLINYLIQEKGLNLGVLSMRDPMRGPFDLPLVLNPRSTNFTGRVAVLIDEASISNSEILAAGLRDAGRATIFGQRTAGLALPSTVERLPNGDGFQYAFASYTSASGALLEGHGVEPDVQVMPDRAMLLVGIDPALATAVAWIRAPRMSSIDTRMQR